MVDLFRRFTFAFQPHVKLYLVGLKTLSLGLQAEVVVPCKLVLFAGNGNPAREVHIGTVGVHCSGLPVLSLTLHRVPIIKHIAVYDVSEMLVLAKYFKGELAELAWQDGTVSSLDSRIFLISNYKQQDESPPRPSGRRGGGSPVAVRYRTGWKRETRVAEWCQFSFSCQTTNQQGNISILRISCNSRGFALQALLGSSLLPHAASLSHTPSSWLKPRPGSLRLCSPFLSGTPELVLLIAAFAESSRGSSYQTSLSTNHLHRWAPARRSEVSRLALMAYELGLL